MSSIDVALDALDAAIEELAAADLDAVDAVERYRVLDRLETARRRQIALAHDHVARLEHVPGCPPPGVALADVLRISRAEARRRLRDADQLKARTTLTGEPVPPLLPATAQPWHDGLLDGEHLEVIQKFFRDLPDHITPAEIEKAEASLAKHATELRPDQASYIGVKPEGPFKSDHYRY